MKIILLGAGVVGATLAEQLANEQHDVSIIDHDAVLLHKLHRRMDIKIVCGQASYPDVMRDAGAEHADMIVAVTNNDEVNMVACQVAYSLFDIPLKIARIRTPHYFIRKELYSDAHLPIDVFINPEVLLTRHIRQLLTVPGSLQVLDFFAGKAKLVSVVLSDHVPLQKRRVDQCFGLVDGVGIVAVFRKQKALSVQPDLMMEPEDEVFFIAANKKIERVMKVLHGNTQPCKRVMIAGGGHIGQRLAAQLGDDHTVKLIDHNAKRCTALTTVLDHVLVLHGEASDKDMLVNEEIDHVDAFCAVTDSDEANIMACLQAKRLGAKRVIALVNRVAYLDVIADSQIDVALNPQGVTVSGILSHIRQGDLLRVYAVHGGTAEAIEAVVLGDVHSSPMVGRSLRELNLPEGICMVAMMRDDDVSMVKQDTVFETDDHVMLFIDDKKHVPYVEKLFQVHISEATGT